MRWAIGVVGCLVWVGAVQAQDFSEGGAYDSIEIAGFVVAVEDVARLTAAGLLRFDPERSRFSFGQTIRSERSLRQEANALALDDPRAIVDLYRATQVPLPNGAAHTLTVPSGFGPAHFVNQTGGLSFGLSAGGVARVPYTDKPDGAVALGIGFGNAFDTVGVSVSMSFNDLSEFPNDDRIAWGFEISRYLWDGLSVAVGGENLFVGQTDGEESFYGVASWAFAKDTGFLPFDGVLTVGAGSGRFANKTERDAAEGKGTDATVLFGAMAWEITETLNAMVEWNGRNLAIGGSFRVPGTPISARIGMRDLTDNTGDGPRLTGSVGVALARF